MPLDRYVYLVIPPIYTTKYCAENMGPLATLRQKFAVRFTMYFSFENSSAFGKVISQGSTGVF